MTIGLTDEQSRLVGLAREVSQPFKERSLDFDKTASFPEKNFQDLKDAGLLKMTVPERFGGHGLWQGSNFLAYYLVLSEIARYCSSTSQLLQVHSHAVGMIAHAGNQKQLEHYMPVVAEEGKLFASCGSEASARKDSPEGFDCVLREKGEDRTLTGFKGFASLASNADFYLIWTLIEGTRSMDEGIVFVAVPKGADGVRLEDNWDTLGMRPTVSWNIHLKDVSVAEDQIIGEPGSWVQKDARTFTLGFASNHLGQAWAIYDYILDYMSRREDLRSAPTHQVVVGDAEARNRAVEALLQHSARLWEAGHYDAAERSSMCTLHLAKEASLGLATKAFDICGARATFNNQLLNLYLRDVRTFTLHFREDRLLQMLANASTGHGESFHSKLRYGRKIEEGRAAHAAS